MGAEEFQTAANAVKAAEGSPTTPPATPPTTATIAADAHSIAQELKTMNENANRSRSLAIALLGSTLVNLVLIALVVAVLIPVYQTAKLVESVAGPDAVAAQSEQGAKTIADLLAFVVCTTRENTSEARFMNGQPVLPLRKGCPEYNFSPDAPLLPPVPSQQGDAPTRQTTTTKATTAPTTEAPPPTTTSVTATTQRVACPVPVVTTCLTVPR